MDKIISSLFVSIYLSSLIVFLIWYLKLNIERNFLLKNMNKSVVLEEHLNKILNSVENIKKDLESININNLSTKDITLLKDAILILPIYYNLQKKIVKEIKDQIKLLDKKQNTLENTIETANVFLSIISFGCLRIGIFKEY